MPKIFPPRPRYARERITFAYPVLATFVLLFAARLLGRFLPLDALWFSLLLQLIVFLLPVVVFIYGMGRGYTRTLRLHRPYLSHTPLLIAAFFALLSGGMLLSMLCGGTDSLGNSSTSFEQVSAHGVLQGIGVALVLGVIPAVLEELLFRGVVFAELNRRGALRTVLVGPLLFALVHFDLSNLLVYLYAGVLLSLTLYATDSLPATILLHAGYNLVSLFGQRYLNAFYHFTGSVELFIFLLVLLLLGALCLFCRECARLYRMRVQAGLRTPRRAIPYNVQLYTMIDALGEWPVVLCTLLSVAGFILF